MTPEIVAAKKPFLALKEKRMALSDQLLEASLIATPPFGLLLLCRRYALARYAWLIYYRSYFEPLIGVGFGREGERNNWPIGS